MEKLVEGFGSDLESLRAVSWVEDVLSWSASNVDQSQADPTLGPGRLQLLIDSLAAGKI